MIAAAIVLLATAGSVSATDLPRISLPSDPELLRVAVVADTGRGAGPVAEGILAVQRTMALDAVILAGDNVYPCGIGKKGDAGWSRVQPLAALGIPLVAALGNHDHCGDPALQVASTDVAHWTMPAAQYVVESAVADFLVLDSTPLALGRDTTGTDVLREAFRKSRKRWRIVVSHHPPYSSGVHGRTKHDGLRRIRALAPTMRTLGVDLVIAGHDHHQELIDSRPAVLISGAGSDPEPLSALRDDTRWPARVRPEPIAFSLLEVGKRTMRVRFYDARGKAISEWMEIRNH